MSAKTFLVLVIVSIVIWFYRSDEESRSGPVAAFVRAADNVIFRSNSGSGNGSSSEEDQEQGRQRRQEAAEQNLRLSNDRQAARQRATDEYEKQRLALAQQIDALERSNNHGVNNTAIEELTRQRAALSLPQ